MTNAIRPRRADAQRNVETILAAGLDVLAEQPDAGLGTIARAAGLTRTTLYAHFGSREELLDALVRRAIDEAVAQVDAGGVDRGPPDEALLRVLRTSWRAVDRHRGVLETAEALLGPERMAAHHAPLRARLLALVERGRTAGVFRTDVPATWLLATYFALVHLAGAQVNVGALDEAAAESALCATVAGAFGVSVGAAQGDGGADAGGLPGGDGGGEQ